MVCKQLALLLSHHCPYLVSNSCRLHSIGSSLWDWTCHVEWTSLTSLLSLNLFGNRRKGQILLEKKIFILIFLKYVFWMHFASNFKVSLSPSPPPSLHLPLSVCVCIHVCECRHSCNSTYVEIRRQPGMLVLSAGLLSCMISSLFLYTL